MIKFSLIMPAYNAEKYINEAIESVIAQTYDNWELIIVDDGSTDKTAEIIDRYHNNYQRIIAIHQNNSGTAAAARNTALKYVSGDYVQMIDADDCFQENLLSEFNDKLIRDDLDIIVPNCICFENDNKNDIFWEKVAPNNDYNSVLSGERAFELSLDWTIHGFFLVKKEIVLKVKYDSELINGDEFTTRKFLYNANRIGFVNSYYYYRRNMESTTRNNRNKYRMYECLITDLNIYKYAVNNKMNDTIIKKCKDKLTKAFFIYCKKIEKDKDDEFLDEKSAAERIIEKVCSELSYDIVKTSSIKYRLFYKLGRGEYWRIKEMMKFAVRLSL